MQLIRGLIPSVLLLLVVAFSFPAGHAAGPAADCKINLIHKLERIVAQDVAVMREEIQTEFPKLGIPVFTKQTRSGEIPVVLVNQDTAPKMQYFLDNSYGPQTQLQPNWNNDHGSVRVMDRIADVDTPGARGFGEINATGIAWKPLQAYLPRRQSVILEVAYALTPAEKEAVEYYHRVRRAAVIRVPFTFGGGNNNMNLPNMLTSGEHCFIFCSGQAAKGHVSEISNMIHTAAGKPTAEFMRVPEVIDFLAAARKRILEATPDNKLMKKFNEQIIAPELKRLNAVLPQEMPDEQRRVLGNWIVGFEATQDYSQVLSALGVSSVIRLEDMHNPRATAVLIYDSVDKAKAFNDATYSSPGKFYQWTAEDQKPIPR